MAPPSAWEHNGKRKREQTSNEEGDEDGTMRSRQEENICPNSSVDKTTPVRKARNQTKGGQKLFSSAGDATKAKGIGEEEDLTAPCLRREAMFLCLSILSCFFTF